MAAKTNAKGKGLATLFPSSSPQAGRDTSVLVALGSLTMAADGCSSHSNL